LKLNLCIIPARGGSKRIPRKNIRDFGGQPMISWSIKAALESKCFDHIVVSTDDSEIAELSKLHGAEVPFIRPASLSDDYVATRPVINHAITEISKIHSRPTYVCCLYPTAPFVRSSDLSDALDILLNNQFDFVSTASSYSVPIQWAFSISEKNSLKRLYPEHRLTRSQDLPNYFFDAGQFYWGRTECFLNNQDPLGDNCSVLQLPKHLVHDIDTPEDLELAELIFLALQRFL
jgi:pseudaminic acid cytidylyltransferase